jgi:hypothetical protein
VLAGGRARASHVSPPRQERLCDTGHCAAAISSRSIPRGGGRQPARLTSMPAFQRRFDGLNQEAKLRRVPRDSPPDHSAAEWLKLQSFTASVPIEQSVVTSPRPGRSPVRGLRAARAPGALAQSRARLPAREGAATVRNRLPRIRADVAVEFAGRRPFRARPLVIGRRGSKPG